MIERVRQGRFGLRMWWLTSMRERGRDESESEAESLEREKVR